MSTNQHNDEATLRAVMTVLDALALVKRNHADKADANRAVDQWNATMLTGEYVGVINAHQAVRAMLDAELRRQMIAEILA